MLFNLGGDAAADISTIPVHNVERIEVYRGYIPARFGGTFMGTTSLVMTIARQLSVPGNLNLLGFVTLIYGIGQILGPALTSMLGNGTSALASATLCGAAALFIAALISTVQLFKLQVVTS